VDLVALDTTQTLSDLQLLPAGRQREPLSALRRAQIVVLTRIDSADPQYLEKRVLDVHPAARVFRSRTRLITCRDAWSGECISSAEIGSRKAAAFCAIGNPGAFFGDLRRWGFKLVVEHAFPDHHAYTGGEIQRLVANARTEGAGALVTTQKDAVKFSRDWNPQLPIWASEIEAQILDAEDFERVLLSYLERAH
jgi:tetraacyldisaccharide 4'-kinase